MVFWVVVGILILGAVVLAIFLCCCHINPREDGE
jgi:hypothetical protein